MEPQQTNQENSNPMENAPVKKTTISTGAAIVTAGVIIAIAIMFSGGIKKQAAQPTANNDDTPAEVTSIPKDVATVRPTDFIFGNKNADIVVFEYADSDCVFCQKFHPTMQSIVKQYNGKVAWVYRLFPLVNLHPNAATEATALTCVAKLGGNDKFWDYLDTLINITLAPDPKSNEALFTFAEKIGVKKADLAACMKDPGIEAAIKATTVEASKIGARGTPFSVAVNIKTGEQQVIAGAYPLEDVKAKIDSLLK